MDDTESAGPTGHHQPCGHADGRPAGALFGRRRAKIADEIARNRRGEYAVPTWVLGLLLIVVVAAFAALVALS
jgi:hypothetical protein